MSVDTLPVLYKANFPAGCRLASHGIAWGSDGSLVGVETLIDRGVLLNVQVREG